MLTKFGTLLAIFGAIWGQGLGSRPRPVIPLGPACERVELDVDAPATVGVYMHLNVFVPHSLHLVVTSLPLGPAHKTPPASFRPSRRSEKKRLVTCCRLLTDPAAYLPYIGSFDAAAATHTWLWPTKNDVKLEALGQRIPPPRHVFHLWRSGSGSGSGFLIRSPPKFNYLFICLFPTFPGNFMQIRLEVFFSQSC